MENAGTKLTEKQLRKQYLVSYFGGACNECNIVFDPWMYDFHHIKPERKRFKLSGANLLRKWDDVLHEAENCIMVCPNCHRFLHKEEQIAHHG